MAEANRFLKEVYLAQHNARFATQAEDQGTAFVTFAAGQAICRRTRSRNAPSAATNSSNGPLCTTFPACMT